MQLDNWVTRVPDQPTPLPPSYDHVALDLFVFVASSASSSFDASPTSLPFLHGFASTKATLAERNALLGADSFTVWRLFGSEKKGARELN